MDKKKIRVLLVDDNEDDYVIIEELLSMVRKTKFELHWARDAREAFCKVKKTNFDVCLLNYRLGDSNGLQILSEMWQHNINMPVIVLTGHGDYNADIQAMKLGASDYLEKGNLNSVYLERAIRYAIDRSKTMASLRRSERKLRRLSAKLLEAQENERKILARELHDSLGSSLTAIRYALEQNVGTMVRRDDVPEVISLEQVIEMVKDAIKESHRITSHLRPSVLDDLGLVPALRSLTREFKNICSDVHIDTQLEVGEGEIPESLKIVIYRIAQEALHNTSKYSSAGSVFLKLERRDEGIELLVRDNGCGFDYESEISPKSSESGMGLVGMKERAVLSNGILKVWSEKGKGTEIRVHWPLLTNL